MIGFDHWPIIIQFIAEHLNYFARFSLFHQHNFRIQSNVYLELDIDCQCWPASHHHHHASDCAFKTDF